jgi:hypothetical protein
MLPKELIAQELAASALALKVVTRYRKSKVACGVLITRMMARMVDAQREKSAVNA